MGVEGKVERFLHRGPVPTNTHQPERLVCSPTRDGQGLGAEAQALVGSQGEDWGWLCEHSLKGARAPQLAVRESRKKTGADKRLFLASLFTGTRGEGIKSTT